MREGRRHVDHSLANHGSSVDEWWEACVRFAAVGEALGEIGRHAEALPVFEKALQLTRERDASVYLGILMADAQFWMGRVPQAEASLRSLEKQAIASVHAPLVPCALSTVARLLHKAADARRYCATAEEVHRGCSCSVAVVDEPTIPLAEFTQREGEVAFAALQDMAAGSQVAVVFIQPIQHIHQSIAKLVVLTNDGKEWRRIGAINLL